MRELLPLAALGLLAACAGTMSDPTGQSGGQQAIMSYYDQNATEQHMACNDLEMTDITRTTVVQDTPQNLVLDVRYAYQPSSRGGSSSVDGQGHASHAVGCDGFATRQFTLTRTPEGAAVRSMTGEQRGGLAAQG